MADLFDLLDKELDDLKDLPSFKAPDTGIYKLHVTAELKEINKKPSVSWNYTVREIVELADDTIPEEERAKKEDKFNIANILKDEDGNDSEMGWGKLKEQMKPFEAHFGISNLKQLLQGPLKEGVDITAKVKKVERKKEKDVYDARIEDVTID